MSTALNDFAAGVLCLTAVAPNTITESTTGSAVDMVAGDGNGFALLAVGTRASGTQVAGYLEQSEDAQSWDAIEGTEFDASGTPNTVRSLSFQRSARYVRGTITVTGTSAQAYATLLVGQQRKEI